MKTWCFLLPSCSCHSSPFSPFLSSLLALSLCPIVCSSTNSFLRAALKLETTSSTGRDAQQLGVCFPRAIPSQGLCLPGAKVIHTHQTWGTVPVRAPLWVRLLLPYVGPLPEAYTYSDSLLFCFPDSFYRLCNAFLVNHLYPCLHLWIFLRMITEIQSIGCLFFFLTLQTAAYRLLRLKTGLEWGVGARLLPRLALLAAREGNESEMKTLFRSWLTKKTAGCCCC